MLLIGPCFSVSIEKITCLFTDEEGDVTSFTNPDGTQTIRVINGITVNGQAVCPMPLFRALGEHSVKVILRNGTNYTGYFNVGMYVHMKLDFYHLGLACAGLICSRYVCK